MIVTADTDRIDEVAARMDLRPPNRRALESFVGAKALYYSDEGAEAPFECVIDSATGVGKTYVMAAIMEYLAGAEGVRNFAVITPGKTIREKTIANFTRGHRKSLLGTMQLSPLVITADNFDTPAIRTAIDDDSVAKLYIFTVQALLQPTTEQGRKTHDFQEGLGAGLYEHMADLEDLVVFADEHHCYYGPAFSRAVRGLNPYAIVGLTATPNSRTPRDQIVYSYPLAAAIAEKWVKTPVIVGRRDDRTDPETKLADGLRLLDYKQGAIDAYCAETGSDPVRPVMLVVAQNTADADEFASILGSQEFDGGRWADTILVIHSNLRGDKKEDALAALESVEDKDSPVRIIISVGMLKEGWDVKNVYVIASLRASVSSVLTEQTLGRGLRLPFGAHTGVELLDTVEVVAHERYEDLLKKAEVLNEAFIDQYTWAELRKTVTGEVEVTQHSDRVAPPILVGADQTAVGPAMDPEDSERAAPEVAPVEDRTAQMEEASQDLTLIQTFPPKVPIAVPIVRFKQVEAHFGLADIDDFEPFRRLGRQLAADPDGELQRTKISAQVITGLDGLRRTVLIPQAAKDHLEATETLFPLETLVGDLVEVLLASPVVPARADQAKAALPLINAFIEGLGSEAQRLLSAYSGRAAARLVKLVTDEHRKVASQPHVTEVVEIRDLDNARIVARAIELNRNKLFSRGVAYDSWTKSIYEADWFDSRPERSVAIIAEDADEVEYWVRLQVGDLPIVWRSDGREYNPDLIVVETDDHHWLVEVKADKDVTSVEVEGKRRAAQRWVNHVNASGLVKSPWGYLLVSETDIEQARHSWPVLKQLGLA